MCWSRLTDAHLLCIYVNVHLSSVIKIAIVLIREAAILPAVLKLPFFPFPLLALALPGTSLQGM